MKDFLGKHALFALHLLIAIAAAMIIVLASRAASAHEFDCPAHQTARAASGGLPGQRSSPSRPCSSERLGVPAPPGVSDPSLSGGSP
jgi:hypothetical protein